MSRLALHTLGLPRMERDGVPLEVPRRRAVALLIYLAMTGHKRSQARSGLSRTLSTHRRSA